MKKILSVVSLFLTMVAPIGTAFASDANGLTVAEDCVPGPQIGAKIGNWEASDLGSSSNYVPCDRFLLPNDPLAKTMLYYVSDKETVLEVKDNIEALGGNFEAMTEGFRGRNAFLVLFNTLMLGAFVAAAVYSATRVSKVFRESNVTENAARGSAMLAALTIGYYFLYNLPLYIARGVIYFTSSYNFMVYNFHDFDSLEKVTASDDRLDQYAETFNAQNYSLADALVLNEMVNVVTDNSIMTRNVGSTVNVDRTWASIDNDIKNPTLSEYLTYHESCKQRRFATVSKDYEINFAMLFEEGSMITSVPETAYLMSGGDTVNDNCPYDSYFGKESKLFTVKQNTNLVLQNFLRDKFGGDYANDTTAREQVVEMFSSTTGIINNGLEKISEAAAANPEGIKDEIEMALAAVKEASSNNMQVKDTASFLALSEKIQRETASAFSYSNPDSVEMSDIMLIDAVKAIVYKFGKLFTPGERDYVKDYNITGYDYIKDFLEETSRQALLYDCAVMKGDKYAQQVQAAQVFNSSDKNELNKNSKLPEIAGFECYDYDPSTQTVVAAADPSNAPELKKSVQDRTFAIKVLFDAYDRGLLSNMVIEEDSEKFVSLRLEFLNKLKLNLFSAIRSSYIFMDQENEIRQSLSAVKETLSITSDMNIDTTIPTSYFNKIRFTNTGFWGSNEDTHQEMDSERAYQFNYVFNSVLGHDAATESSGPAGAASLFGDEIDMIFQITGISDMWESMTTLAECPVRSPDGDCEASLQQINYASLNNMMVTASVTTATAVGLNMLVGVCHGSSGGDDTFSVGGAVSKTPMGKIGKMLGCGLLAAVDFLMPAIFLTVIVMWLLVVFAFIASYMPIVIDALLFVMVLVYVIIPIIMLPIVFTIEALKASIIYTLFKQERTNQSFTTTVAILKSLIFRPFILLSILSVYVFFQTSPSLGGSIYDLLQQVDLWIVADLIIMASVSWMAMKGATVALNIEQEMLQLLGVRSQPFFKETGQVGQFFMGYVLRGAQGGVGNKIKSVSGQARKIGTGIPQKNAQRKKAQEEKDLEPSKQKPDDEDEAK